MEVSVLVKPLSGRMSQNITYSAVKTGQADGQCH